MLLADLEKKKLIQPPQWITPNVHYLVMMGSVAYGVSSDTSDKDIYGWCVPLKDMVFPHLRNPNQDAIKQVLLKILEAHYGSLDKCIENVDKYKEMVSKIREIVNE